MTQFVSHQSPPTKPATIHLSSTSFAAISEIIFIPKINLLNVRKISCRHRGLGVSSSMFTDAEEGKYVVTGTSSAIRHYCCNSINSFSIEKPTNAAVALQLFSARKTMCANFSGEMTRRERKLHPAHSCRVDSWPKTLWISQESIQLVNRPEQQVVIGWWTLIGLVGESCFR